MNIDDIKNEKHKTAIKRYIAEEGSIKRICKDLHMSTSTLSNLLQRLNIKIKGKSSTKIVYSESQIAELVSRINNGESIRDICKETGENRVRISHALATNGVKVTARKYRVKEDLFDNIDSEEKAYWLGFLYADGNIDDYHGKYSVRIGLKWSDKKHLEKFRDFCESDAPIAKRSLSCSISTSDKNKKRDYCFITISSKKLCEGLIGHGCTPRKTFTTEFPSWLRADLKIHFIRGVFDGDGWISIEKGKKETHASICVFGVCGTYSLMNGIKEWLQIGASVIPSSSIFRVTCRGNGRALSIFDELYKDATIFLERKYIIYKNHKHYLKCRLEEKSSR